MEKNWIKEGLFRLKRFLAPACGREEKKPEKPRARLTARSDIRIVDGHLDVPEDIDEIGDNALAGRTELRSVFVPATVWRIGEEAFAGCVNLERVVLSEGLERIGRDAFSGCTALRSLTVPDSVRELTGWAFRGSGIGEPVLNAAGDTLYFCPAQVAGREYAVPQSIRRIGGGAFFQLKDLEKVTLPETLECIGAMAFLECGLMEAAVPAGVREIGEGPFRGCWRLKTIRLTGEKDPVHTAVTMTHLRGKRFLAPCRPKLPEDEYWKTAAFRALAKKCETGGAGAMEELTAFFEAKQREDPETAFYGLAANFWRFRVWERGSEKAGAWLEAWLRDPENERLPAPYLTEMLSGLATGRGLNALGFLFFDPEREYSLDGRDAEGVVEVSAYESEDGPDEDGFGRETYYDWWYLDGDLCPLPGVDWLHSYSSIDRRGNERRFAARHAAAAAAVARRAGKEK